MKTDEALEREQELLLACQSDPGLWNIVQAEREWLLYGDACDPLSPSAPEHALKSLQRDIYLELWAAPLSLVDADSRVLVAGGGTGRFAQVLASKTAHVDLIDASPQAVQRARVHLGDTVRASVGDLCQADTLAAQAYDLILAVEVPCYATDPGKMMANLVAALKPGGQLLFSVEAAPGALLADRDLASPRSVEAVLDQGEITLPGLKHVHYYSREQTQQLAAQHGLEVQDVSGVCYVPDGPFAHLIDASRLEDAEYRTEIQRIERRCREHPVLKELPRAWAATTTRAT